MMHALAKWRAKRSYIWQLEVEASKGDLNAGTANQNAESKRKLVAQLNAEADAIEKNIEAETKKIEVGFWECECGKENFDYPSVPQVQVNAIHCQCGKEMKLVKLSEMIGQEKYELEKQKGEAQKLAEEKRALAKQEQENVDAAVQAVKMLAGRAQDSRTFADKIREL